ncbi:MAG: hypothetical protein ABFC34_14175, partial [Methanobacterium sp.]
DLIKIDDEGIEYNFKGDKLSTEEFKFLKNESLHGYDFDQTMVRISLMNLMMMASATLTLIKLTPSPYDTIKYRNITLFLPTHRLKEALTKKN